MSTLKKSQCVSVTKIANRILYPTHQPQSLLPRRDFKTVLILFFSCITESTVSTWQNSSVAKNYPLTDITRLAEVSGKFGLSICNPKK